MIHRYHVLIFLLALTIAACKSSSPSDPGTGPSPVVPSKFYVGLMYPRSGPMGTTIALRGHGFGTLTDSCTVTMGNTTLPILSIQDDEILAQIPKGAVNGSVILTRGVKSDNAGLFTVTKSHRPGDDTICCIYPDSARPGDIVTIYGDKMTGQTAAYYVFFDSSRAQIIDSLSDWMFRVVVPQVNGPYDHAVTMQLRGALKTAHLFSFPFTMLSHTPPLSLDAVKFNSIKLDFGGIESGVSIVTSYDTTVTTIGTSTYAFGVTAFAPQLVSRGSGANGIDTLAFSSARSYAPHDVETRSIHMIVDKRGSRILSMTYWRERIGHSESLTADGKYRSEWANGDSITFSNLPCISTLDKGLECSLFSLDLGPYTTAGTAYGTQRDADTASGPTRYIVTTFDRMAPPTEEGYLHVKLY
ncbi:MAG: hypothetical protein JWQ98_2708 [Chlorobi bacterium]|nr:hypothetical protein [Chlorobiota bacterium]